MNTARLLSTLLFFLVLVIVTACDDDKNRLVDSQPLPAPGLGEFVSDTLNAAMVMDAATSRDGDVFLLSGSLVPGDLNMHVSRVSPYGQLIFQQPAPGLFAAITATSDNGCVVLSSPNPHKINGDGEVVWQLDTPATAAVPRPDGSVVLAGHDGENDTTFHVGAVNAVGMTLWETSFERNEREIISAGALAPSSEIALLVYEIAEVDPDSLILFPGDHEPGVVHGIQMISSDGSSQSRLELEDPGFQFLTQEFVALPGGGFAAIGIVDDFLNDHVVEWDADGTIVWDYQLEGDLSWIETMALAPDGGLLLLGRPDGLFGAKLQRFDAAHTLLWSRTYAGDPGDDPFDRRSFLPLDVAVLPDGTIQVSVYATAVFENSSQVVIYREEDSP